MSIIKSAKWLLFPLSVIIIMLGLFCIILYGIQANWFDEESENDLIRRIEFFAKEKLPSCEVLKKEYNSGYYSIAIYKVDSTDFVKVFNILDTDTTFVVLENNDFRIETKQLIAKSLRKTNRKRLSTDILIYKNDVGHYIYKVGFICPEIIVIERENQYPGNE